MVAMKVWRAGAWREPNLKVREGGEWAGLRDVAALSSGGFSRVLRVIGNTTSSSIVKYNPVDNVEFPFTEYYSTSSTTLVHAGMANARVHNRVLRTTSRGFRGGGAQPVPSGYVFSGKILILAKLQWDTTPPVSSASGSSGQPALPRAAPAPLPERDDLPVAPDPDYPDGIPDDDPPPAGPSGQQGVPNPNLRLSVEVRDGRRQLIITYDRVRAVTTRTLSVNVQYTIWWGGNQPSDATAVWETGLTAGRIVVEAPATTGVKELRIDNIDNIASYRGERLRWRARATGLGGGDPVYPWVYLNQISPNTAAATVDGLYVSVIASNTALEFSISGTLTSANVSPSRDNRLREFQWRKYTGTSRGSDLTASWSNASTFMYIPPPSVDIASARAITTLRSGQTIRVRGRMALYFFVGSGAAQRIQFTGQTGLYDYAEFRYLIPSISLSPIVRNNDERPTLTATIRSAFTRFLFNYVNFWDLDLNPGKIDWAYQTYSGTAPTGSSGSWTSLASNDIGSQFLGKEGADVQNTGSAIGPTKPANETGIRFRARVRLPRSGPLLAHTGQWVYSPGWTYPAIQLPPPTGPDPEPPAPVAEVRPTISRLRVEWSSSFTPPGPRAAMTYNGTDAGTRQAYVIEIRQRLTNAAGTGARGAWNSTDHAVSNDSITFVTQQLFLRLYPEYLGVQARIKTQARTGANAWTGPWQNATPYPYQYPDLTTEPPPPDPPTEPPPTPAPTAPTGLTVNFIEPASGATRINITVSAVPSAGTTYRTRARWDGGSWSVPSPRNTADGTFAYSTNTARGYGIPTGARTIDVELRARGSNTLVGGPVIRSYTLPVAGPTPIIPSNLMVAFSAPGNSVLATPSGTNAVSFRTRARWDDGTWTSYSPSATGWSTSRRTHVIPSPRPTKFTLEVTGRSTTGHTVGPTNFDYNVPALPTPPPPEEPPPDPEPEPEVPRTTGNQPLIDVEVSNQTFPLGELSPGFFEVYPINVGRGTTPPSTLKFVCHGRESTDPHPDYEDVTMWPSPNYTDISREWCSVMMILLYDQVS